MVCDVDLVLADKFDGIIFLLGPSRHHIGSYCLRDLRLRIEGSSFAKCLLLDLQAFVCNMSFLSIILQDIADLNSAGRNGRFLESCKRLVQSFVFL